MRRKIIIALGLIGLGLLGGCGDGGNTAITTIPTAHLAITLATTTVTAGTPFTFTVKALDTQDAVVPTYTGTVHITTSDTDAKLPANATLAQGVGTFTVTFFTTGNQTITASDTVGDASPGTSPAISVQPIPVPRIASLSPGTTVVGGAGFTLIVYGSNFVLTSVVRWNGSNRSTGFVSSGQLTAQITAADVVTAGAATVTVFNPAPGGGTSNSSILVLTTAGNYPQSITVDPSGNFAYVLNGGGGGDGSVSMYMINPATGVLTSIGQPVSTEGFGVYPGSIAVDPSGRFVYLTNDGDPWGYEGGADGSIEIYSVGTTTGALTNTGTINGNCPGLCEPSAMATDPAGRFVYVTIGGAGGPFSLAMYTIDATTGALASIGTIATEGGPSFITVDPAGKFVYVTASGGTVGSAGILSVYAINAATGTLASIGTIAAGTAPSCAVVDPSDQFAYVTDSGLNDVLTYTVNSATGSLTLIGTIASGLSPSSIAVHPSGNFAYVVNSGSNDVSMYSIGANGALTLIGTIGT